MRRFRERRPPGFSEARAFPGLACIKYQVSSINIHRTYSGESVLWSSESERLAERLAFVASWVAQGAEETS
jgi:hypothetical protein